ncbi:MAG: methyltransferase domain-containing protein [Clostridia bacterium]|nr:methyltransferase domain-containing protein [Clostridia bacterium]
MKGFNRLLCPICHGKLSSNGKSLSCGKNHSFDISSDGYVNLAVGKSGSGDALDMCRARRDFLSRGYYLPFAESVSEEAGKFAPKSSPLVCDAGCGEGFYLRVMKKNLADFEFIGFDLAKDSIRFAAKAEKNSPFPITYAVSGIFDMPLSPSSCSAVISIFAPIPHEEAERILVEDGILLVAHPGEKHLSGFKKNLYDVPYDNEEKELHFPNFELVHEKRVKYTVFIEKSDMKNLLLMTPYYWKTSREDTDRFLTLNGFETELDFIISVFKKSRKM